MVVFANFYLNICAVFGIIIYCCYLYLTRTFDHWKKKGVAFQPPLPLFGNFFKLFLLRDSHRVITQKIYNSFPKEPFVGLFTSSKPILLIRDPDLIKQILVKDIQHFHNRFCDVGHVSEDEPLSQNLVVLSGPKWRQLRQKLTPTFSSGKLKAMFNLLVEAGNNFENELHKCADSESSFEMKDLTANYAMQTVTSVAFGFDANESNELTCKFKEVGTKALSYFTTLAIKYYLKISFPFFGKYIPIKTLPESINNFYINLTKDIIANRKENNISRSDFIQLLMQLQDHGFIDNANESDSSCVFDDGMVAAQAFIFLLAGDDSTSNVMSFILYELALNPGIQTKVQEEIDAVLQKHNGLFTYDAFQELSYLDQVLSEGLRKYPAATHLERICTIPYTIPGTTVSLDVNDWVTIPAYALHYDPEYFPNPLQFDPERFSPERKKTIHPCTYMPFGEGPRSCIAQRFAKMQIIAGLVATLRNFRVCPCPKTEKDFKFNLFALNLQAANGVWLQIKHRE